MSTVPREPNSAASPVRVDVGIITVLESELEAILTYIPRHGTVSGRRQYNMCRLETQQGDAYEIAVVRSLESGTGEATELARDLLEELSPTWLFVVGIAGGVGDQVAVGDVVVSSRIADITKETSLGDESQYSVGGGTIAHEAAIVIANLPASKAAMEGWDNVQILRPEAGKWKAGPRVITGTIASTDRLVRDPASIENWREQIRGLRAVEMESAGVYRVASKRDVPFVAIRGIADIIGAQKTDSWRGYASHIAASFTAAFLRTRPFAPRSLIPVAKTSAPIALSSLITRDHAPFHLQGVSLTDVRGFDSLEIQVPNARPDAGQWTILLGANGVGKTSILRALALALSTDEVIQALLGRLGSSSPMVRIGATNATIRISCAGGDLPRIVLGAGETGDRLDQRGSGDLSAPFLVAYGCRRGSVLGGPSRDVNIESPLSAVETLFDDSAGLVHAETWLKQRKLAATMSPGSPDEAFLGAVLCTLIRMLPGVDEILVTAHAVEVDGPGVGRIPLGALSDGYLTTAGWVLDLIARWSEDAMRRGIVLDESFREKMTGVAIVDEIDLHLHPRWQRDVVADIRRLFPRMSFVVTTHNPLTLLGAAPGEVFVMQRDEKTGRVDIHQRDLPPGLGAEGVLTGEWFGLASTLDDGTLELLTKHRQLLRSGSPDGTEAKALEKELTARLGSYAATSLERMAQSAAAQVLDEDVRKLSAEDREVARAKIADLLRAPARSAQSRKPRRTKRAAH